jgi:hypothetical protein
MITFIIILFLLLPASYASALEIAFQNKPEIGLPREAREQKCADAHSFGSLHNTVADSVSHISIRYFSKTWKDEQQIRLFIKALLADERTAVYCYPAWAHILLEPSIEGVVYYKNFRRGKLLLWDFVGCLKDDQGQWLFVLFPKDFKKGNQFYQKTH